ncbi:MAG: hypothetical protein HYX90_06740 [Chloroflexi bacterium]|nr:hypothetical protein [Chloroflexota bacterium]
MMKLQRCWLLLVAPLLVILSSAGVILASRSGHDPVSALTRQHTFSVLQWESDLLLRFGPSWSGKAHPGLAAERPTEVLQFFGYDRAIERLKAAAESPGMVEQESVQTVIRDQISEALDEQGLSKRVLTSRVVFPPVKFKFTNAPNLLVVSPRDRIYLSQTVLLDPNLSEEQILKLESDVENLGLSSVIERIGGLALYPSMVPENGDLRYILETVAHEWFHQYLFLRPLGRAYWSSYDMTIINETVTEMAGKEIGDSVYQRYYAAAKPPQVIIPLPRGSIDYGKEMRSTRLEADRLLGQGRIDDAEQFMQQRREFLEDHGYHVRKLNQAYFAFHGSYGDDPGAVSPLPGKIRELRERSGPLVAFVNKVSRVTKPEDLERLQRE